MQLELFAPRAPTVFVRHRRARRYILRLLDDGTLRVTLPRWGSKREAQAFVERRRPSIPTSRCCARALPGNCRRGCWYWQRNTTSR